MCTVPVKSADTPTHSSVFSLFLFSLFFLHCRHLSRLPPESVPLLVWAGFGGRRQLLLAIAAPFFIYPFVLSCSLHTWFSFPNQTSCIYSSVPPRLCVRLFCVTCLLTRFTGIRIFCVLFNEVCYCIYTILL